METEKIKPYHIYVQPGSNYVHMEWKGYATSEEFRDGTELMLNLLIENKLKRVLADVKEMVLIGMDDQRWMEKFFLPRASRFGFKACAIVNPVNYFNKIAIEGILAQIDARNMQVALFNSAAEGKDWLNKLEF